MSGQAPVRVGLLGAAAIAPAALIRPAGAVPDVSVAAIAARDSKRAQRFARKHKIPRVHETYEELVADPDLDAVYIPLPNGLHAEWSIRALRAGKHVLCEKPLAANAEEGERMREAAEETGLVLCEALHYRHHPLAARVKAIVDSGELGRLRHVEAHLCVPLPLPGNIRYRYDLAGGATMDVGCYAIDVLRFLAGAEPEVVRARAGLASEQVDRWMEADFGFPDGCTGYMLCSIFSSVLLRSRALARGDEGELRVTNPYMPQALYHRIVVRSRAGRRVEKAPGEATYLSQLRAFIRAVRGQGVVATDAKEGVANLRVIDAVYRKAGLKPRGT